MKAQKLNRDQHSASHNNTVRIEARVDSAIKDLFQRAAEIQDTSLTNFLVTSAKKEAEHIIRQQTIISLSLADSELFAKIMLQENEPNAKLQKAAGRYKQNSAL